MGITGTAKQAFSAGSAVDEPVDKSVGKESRRFPPDETQRI